MLPEVSYQDIENAVKTKALRYYNFYNIDIPTVAQYTSKYYQNHKYDSIDKSQNINTIFTDIEVYTYNQGIDEISDAKFPVNIVTICSNTDRVLHSYVWLLPENVEAFGIRNDPNFNFEEFIANTEKRLIEDLKKLGYLGTKFIPDDYTVKLTVYNDEKKMLYDLWNKIHEYDPDILTSWNGDSFDYPYMYHRLGNLYSPQDAANIMSKFGQISVQQNQIRIFEFPIADLLYLYKPRDESAGGGLNYGKRQAQYSLDHISEVELGMKKIEYKDENTTLDDFYIKDPYNTLLYNIVDVLLICGLHEKNQHIELHNLIRRLMKCPFQSSMAGSSAFFDQFVFFNLSEQHKFIRNNISSENNKALEVQDLEKFQPPTNKKNVSLKPTKIVRKTYSSYINRFPGAFVNIPNPTIINDGSLVADLDATALYPSMILQGNISFDSYKARIIPPACYRTMELLENHLGKSPYPDGLGTVINNMVKDYVYREKVDQKEGNIRDIYYISLYLFDILQTKNIPIENIYNPKNTEQAILLKTVLVPLLDIINTIHQDSKKWNTLAYDYIHMDSQDEFIKKYPKIYILQNPNETNSSIIKCDPGDAIKYIKQYIISYAGTLFYKHDHHTGLFADFLQRMKNMRTSFKSKLKDYEPGSFEYQFNDNRQKSVKVVMNTT